jgi:hypothetical protein
MAPNLSGCFGKAKEVQNGVCKNFFGYEMGSLPFTYLGVPIHFKKLLIEVRMETSGRSF